MKSSASRFGVYLASFILPSVVSSTEIVTLQNAADLISEVTGFPPCDALISAGLGDRILLSTSDAYEPRIESFPSVNGRFRPWCFVQPHTTQEVSLVVKTLENAGSGAGDWHIAVRSGGHGGPGTNNIANGVTIDLGMMNRSSYDTDRKFASIEPGAKWKDVYYNLLHNGNVTVTGGRDGDVGVGGFLLGGGNSYYTGRTGFGCDTVIGFEVVLANGSIIEANANENSNLWKALKGGGLNFGIVTRFDLQAIPAVDIAHGQSVFTSNHSDEVLDAVVDFTNQSAELGDNALITFYSHGLVSSEGVQIVIIRANTRGNLNTTAFDKVNRIPSLVSTWGRKSLADAANDSQLAGGTLNTFKTLTFLNSPSTLRHAAALHDELVSTLTQKIGAENFTTAIFLQPFPTYFATNGQRNGGNMLGLDRITGNAILWQGAVAITNGDGVALSIAQAQLSAMTAKLKSFTSTSGTASDFVYLNYADASQDALGSYGTDNVAFMKEVAKQYDPEGFWQSRVPGGFKLSRVVV